MLIPPEPLHPLTGIAYLGRSESPDLDMGTTIESILAAATPDCLGEFVNCDPLADCELAFFFPSKTPEPVFRLAVRISFDPPCIFFLCCCSAFILAKALSALPSAFAICLDNLSLSLSVL